MGRVTVTVRSSGSERRGRSHMHARSLYAVPAALAMRGHKSAHSFATGPRSQSPSCRPSR